MVRSLFLACLIFVSFGLSAQSFEMTALQETYKGTIGESIRVPLKFKNTTEKPISLIVRRTQEQIGSTQKNFYCLDNHCSDVKVDDILVRLEPGQTLANLTVVLEAGLVPGVSTVRYVAFNRYNHAQLVEFDVNFNVDERTEKESLYQSKVLTLHDVYPNPATDHAFFTYRLTSDKIKAKIRLHNLLGNMIGEYELSAYESNVRVNTDNLNAGIYFYTLYVDNEGVMTRKLLVKK